jgi:hypothetical protein
MPSLGKSVAIASVLQVSEHSAGKINNVAAVPGLLMQFP